MTSTAFGLLARWGPILAWTAVIFWGSSLAATPHLPQPLLDTVVRKLAHMAEYTVLAILLVRGMSPGGARPGLKQVTLAVILAGLYGASDEFHQSFVPGRGPSPVDVAIDESGALLGAIAFIRWRADAA